MNYSNLTSCRNDHWGIPSFLQIGALQEISVPPRIPLPNAKKLYCHICHSPTKKSMNILKKIGTGVLWRTFLFATETCYISDVLHVLLPSNYLMFCYLGLWGYIGYIQQLAGLRLLRLPRNEAFLVPSRSTRNDWGVQSKLLIFGKMTRWKHENQAT